MTKKVAQTHDKKGLEGLLFSIIVIPRHLGPSFSQIPLASPCKEQSSLPPVVTFPSPKFSDLSSQYTPKTASPFPFHFFSQAPAVLHLSPPRIPTPYSSKLICQLETFEPCASHRLGMQGGGRGAVERGLPGGGNNGK